MTVPTKLPASFLEMAPKVVNQLQEALSLDYWLVAQSVAKYFQFIAVTGEKEELVCGNAVPKECFDPIRPSPFQTEEDGPVHFAMVRVPIVVGGEVVAMLAGVHHCDLSPGAYRQCEPLAQLLGRMLSEIVTLQGRLSQSEALCLTDPLTGLLNRRGWEQGLAREHARCQRHQTVALLIAADIDDFKAVNDLHGHPAGDQLLQKVAEILQKTMRATDLVARTGGDEFAILAVQCPENSATILLERLRSALKEASISMSFGVATLDGSVPWPHAWEAADQALYQDKNRETGAG